MHRRAILTIRARHSTIVAGFLDGKDQTFVYFSDTNLTQNINECKLADHIAKLIELIFT